MREGGRETKFNRRANQMAKEDVVSRTRFVIDLEVREGEEIYRQTIVNGRLYSFLFGSTVVIENELDDHLAAEFHGLDASKTVRVLAKAILDNFDSLKRRS
jgi:hypothetical protein